MRTRAIYAASAPTPLQTLIVRRWRPQWVCQTCSTRQYPQRPHSSLQTSSRATATKPYYITTPIFYVNAAPHVGHMYTMVLTDVIKRWQTLKGRRAILCTGTDEHGMKIQQAAAKAGIEPKNFCDKGARVFKELAGSVGLSNDIFIRTTDKKHREAVEYAWQMLERNGYIYESKHEGWYSVSDETFYPAGQVHLIVDPPTGRKIMVSIETGKEVEWTSERNYHFRLSAFRERLLEWYREHPEWVVPQKRMADVVQHVTSGLEDLSVSRPVERLHWGVRVPNDPSQTMYVWLDALLNYATAAGYPFTPGREHINGWPADVHVIGKDIIRFHCVYWPAFLMALDLPLPSRILTHAHWTLGRQKMAKSSGNGVNPFFATERFGIDTMRWYLIHDGGITDDSDYDNAFIVERYKKGLQNGLGNLTSRIMRGRGWNVSRAVRRFAGREDLAGEDDKRIANYLQNDRYMARMRYRLQEGPSKVDNYMNDLLTNRASQAIIQLVYDTNVFTQEKSPWDLANKLADAKADPNKQGNAKYLEAELDQTIFLATESLRIVGIMLQPFIPERAGRLLDMLGVKAERRSWEWCRMGADDHYGVPFVPLGRKDEGVLFPKLLSED